MVGGICAQVCQGGQQIWAGIASSKALVEAMVKGATTCLGDLVSILKVHTVWPVNDVLVDPRGTSILGEVRNVEISRITQQLLCSKSHDFLTVFALTHSKINQIA